VTGVSRRKRAAVDLAAVLDQLEAMIEAGDG